MRGAEARAVAHGIEAEHTDAAGIGDAVALEDLDGRRLARAVRPEQTEHLARRDREREAVDRVHVAVALLEVGDADGGSGRTGHGAAILRSVSTDLPG